MCDCEKLEETQVIEEQVPAKRNDPSYMQIAGDVRKEIGLRFKAQCQLNQLSLGEGLEEAIALWLAQTDPPASGTSAPGTGGKGRGKKGQDD